MTFGKYKRLLLVSVLPLLLAGYLLSLAAMPFREMAYRLCEGYGNFENCRNLGESGTSLYDQTKQKYPKWFQVNTPGMDGAHDVYSVEANARTIGRVTVDQVIPYNELRANPQGDAQMKSLVGRPALLRMGIEDGQRSADTGSEIYLFCHTLDFDKKPLEWFPKPGRYTAQCVAETWGGYISFSPSAEAEKPLVLLRDAVTEEVTDRETHLLTERITLTLAPFVLFLILSAAVLAIRRATAFVRAG